MGFFYYLTSKLHAIQEEAAAANEHHLADIHAHIANFLNQVKQGLINNPALVFVLLSRCTPRRTILNNPGNELLRRTANYRTLH